MPGGTGAGGRPSYKIRGEFREVFSKAISTLDDVSQGRILLKFFECCPKCGHESGETAVPLKTAVSDALRAIDIAGKYGLGEAKGYDEELIGTLAQAVAGHFEGDERLQGLHKAWTEIIGGGIPGGGANGVS